MLPVIYTLDQDRTLRLGMKGIAKLEKVFDLNVDKWNLKELSFQQVGEILAESLKRELPEITADKAMDLVDDYSDPNAAIKKVFECIAATFPKNEQPAVEKPVTPEPAPETPQTILQ
ncbi:hypothetical protein SBF1_50008 [Candidatus Desulfosporosinus infrequens]|uniref:Uncharacterized protein n=1 Tax=Candidatus Desulfosporosinus infrequens TaxID=2043169 RepID=A0A2U3LGZ5_9FIRM|nr:hypothetical protein SBF1_50008 [Candidatus Desulfosporosinus infrequens]